MEKRLEEFEISCQWKFLKIPISLFDRKSNEEVLRRLETRRVFEVFGARYEKRKTGRLELEEDQEINFYAA